MTSTGRYPGYRAPQGNREILCLPSATQLPTLVEQNRSRPELGKVQWFGQSLAEIATHAREELVRAAWDHSRRYANVPPPPPADAPLVVTGHQAELFHPGVWLKNFYAARVARECQGTAINLIIDSDLCRSTAIRVPSGSGNNLHIEMVPFDQALFEMPFEERHIADKSVWASFQRRVSRMLHPQIVDPIIETWWPTVVSAGEQIDNLGLALSQARHQCELNWGSGTLELPQSRICQSTAFRLFSLHLFSHAAAFRDAYNHALYDYRTAHKLANHAHPMPNLVEKDGWIEAPFWLWSADDPRRRGVFVQQTARGTSLSNLGDKQITLAHRADDAVEQLADWESRGIKLRTRALATTLFARLVLADLFIHGIGGAKYDQVTDHISELFFGFSLPPYATISGTLRLPFAPIESQSAGERELRQELRDLKFHPERHLEKMNVPPGQNGELERTITSKRQWVDTQKTPANAAVRHQAIKHANEALQPFLAARREALIQAISKARIDASNTQLRNSREYAYCLFPEPLLREFFDA